MLVVDNSSLIWQRVTDRVECSALTQARGPNGYANGLAECIRSGYCERTCRMPGCRPLTPLSTQHALPALADVITTRAMTTLTHARAHLSMTGEKLLIFLMEGNRSAGMYRKEKPRWSRRLRLTSRWVSTSKKFQPERSKVQLTK